MSLGLVVLEKLATPQRGRQHHRVMTCQLTSECTHNISNIDAQYKERLDMNSEL